MRLYDAHGNLVTTVTLYTLTPLPPLAWTMVEDDGRVITPGNAPCDAAWGVRRSPKWGKTREAYLRKFPSCRVCGVANPLSVHHKQPYHLSPELELVESNLITLCESPVHNCHFLIGHLLDWRSYNVRVEEIADLLHGLILARPLTGGSKVK